MKRFFPILLTVLVCLGLCAVFAAAAGGPVYGDALIAANEQTLHRFVKENAAPDAAQHGKLTLTKEVKLTPQADPVGMQYALQYEADADKVSFSVTPQNWLPVTLSMELAPDGKAVFRHTVLAEDQPDPEAKTLTYDRAALKADDLLVFDDRAGSETAWFLQETETLASWDALLEQCVGMHSVFISFVRAISPDWQPLRRRRTPKPNATFSTAPCAAWRCAARFGATTITTRPSSFWYRPCRE